jgi:hypothetical protein
MGGPVILALALAGCAQSGAPGEVGGLRGEQQRLQRDCDARGGILVPSGRNTGEPPLDNVCSISGGAPARLP